MLEFYLRNFNRVLTDEEILVSAIDPQIGQDIISGTISSTDIVAEKQRLRDITNDVDAMTTEEQLKTKMSALEE